MVNENIFAETDKQLALTDDCEQTCFVMFHDHCQRARGPLPPAHHRP